MYRTWIIMIVMCAMLVGLLIWAKQAWAVERAEPQVVYEIDFTKPSTVQHYVKAIGGLEFDLNADQIKASNLGCQKALGKMVANGFVWLQHDSTASIIGAYKFVIDPGKLQFLYLKFCRGNLEWRIQAARSICYLGGLKLLWHEGAVIWCGSKGAVDRAPAENTLEIIPIKDRSNQVDMVAFALRSCLESGMVLVPRTFTVTAWTCSPLEYLHRSHYSNWPPMIPRYLSLTILEAAKRCMWSYGGSVLAFDRAKNLYICEDRRAEILKRRRERREQTRT